VTSATSTTPVTPATAPPRSNSRILKAKIELALPALYGVIARVWSAPDLRLRYVDYLQTMHQMVRATVPLMAAGIARCEQLAGDPVADGVLAYLRKHIHEENGHDDWVRQDLDLICADADELLAEMPGAEIAAAVGTQYYWLAHHHPLCLLGHIAVLEGYPGSPELPKVLARRTGHPDKAFRTMHIHAVLDQRHRDELFETIDALPLTPGHHAMLGVSALHTIGSVAAVFDGLAARRLAPHRLRAAEGE
jgi:hypothetical protein